MVQGDDDHLYFGDGSRRPIVTADYPLEWGKYKGLLLSEVTDRSYVQWLEKVGVEKNDWFLTKVVTMRLQELT
jgi:hypothetical protein